MLIINKADKVRAPEGRIGGYILSDMQYLIWIAVSEIFYGEQSGKEGLRNDLPPGMCDIFHVNEPQQASAEEKH